MLCPRQLPSGARWVVTHRTLRDGRCQYLTDLNNAPFGAGDPFHILAGGRCRRWPLTTVRGRWPRSPRLPDDLGLIGAKPIQPGQSWNEQVLLRLRVVRHAHVGADQALILLTAPYPNGGVHGGHTVVVWNHNGHGYAVSLHFHPRGSRFSPTERQALALAVAKSMR